MFLYIVNAQAGKSIFSQNSYNGGFTSMNQYNCLDHSMVRVDDTGLSGLTWDGDAGWIWHKGYSDLSDPYSYHLI
ncbi:hypothetical protein HDU99_007720, partial [Rhizoclosmatium hyalinum]